MISVRMGSYIVVAALIALLVSPMAGANGPVDTSTSRLINLQLKDAPVKQAIDSLFQGSGQKYYIQPGVTGRVVELSIKGVTLDEALNALAEAAQFTYRVEDGVYVIGPAKLASQPRTSVVRQRQQIIPPTAAAQGAGPAQQPQAPASVPPAAPAAQVIINQQPPPAYYGPPAPPYEPYGYGHGGYPPAFQYGNVSILGGWSPVVISGGHPYVIRQGPVLPPPPRGWVNADWLRLLRFKWAMQTRTYITPY